MSQAGLKPSRATIAYLIVLAIAVVAQISISLWAVSGKSATSDEPLHIYAGWRSLVHRDLRFNPEHPPLWKYWAALPSAGSLYLAPAERSDYLAITSTSDRAGISTVRDVYWANASTGFELIWRGRCMMAIAAAGLTIAASLLARSLGGNLAGIIAACAVAGDPNTLAHGPLVTNDIPMTALFILTVLMIGSLCERLSVRHVAGLVLLVAVAAGIKFTAVLLAPITGVCLLARAAFGGPWKWRKQELTRRTQRFTAALAISAISAVCGWMLLWAQYGFRFAVTPNGQVFSNEIILKELSFYQTFAKTYPRTPTASEFDAYRPGLSGQMLLFCNRHQLLPNAYLFGMTHAVAHASLRWGYLFGEQSIFGWWYYFPVAMLFKASTAALFMIVGAGAIGSWHLVRSWKEFDSRRKWLLVAVAVCVGVYALQTMSSHLNIGFRHFFPVYYLLIAVSAAALAKWAGTRWSGRAAAIALGCGLLVSVVWTFPNFIPYFNLPSRLAGPPIELLGDSNLDWGQDLPLLAKWQAENPDVRLYLSYCGTADPAAYGIKAIPAYPNYPLGAPPQLINDPGVYAISVSYAQGIGYPTFEKRARVIRGLPVRANLGGSILLIDVPPKTPVPSQ